jgi:hypothetical protein
MALPVVVALLFISDPWSSLSKDGRKVALRDMEAVDRIKLVDVYDSTELAKVDGNWLLFGEEPCNQTSVENLLIAAHRLQISSIVSLDAENDPGTEPPPLRRITCYKGDRVLLSFGFYTHESGQYLVRLPGSELAYFVTVSGYPHLKLHKVFSSASNHYREHLLIDLLPSEISQIGIELPSGEAFGFAQDSLGNIRMEDRRQGISVPGEDINELAVRLLFSYFTSIRYENKSGISAASLSGPGSGITAMATIQVRSFSGQSHQFRIYPYRESPGGEAHLFKALVIYNQEPEALFVNYIYLDVLMRGMSHYLGDK